MRPLTHLRFLLLSLGRLFLPCLSSLELPFVTVDFTLSFLYPRSDLPRSRQGGALTYLGSFPSHDLVLWTDGSVHFPFGKGDSLSFYNLRSRPCGVAQLLGFHGLPPCPHPWEWVDNNSSNNKRQENLTLT